MPSSKSDRPIRKKKIKVQNPKQLFSNFQEAATRYEIEKTAALSAAFVITLESDIE